MRAGILTACEKLPVSLKSIEEMTARVERKAYSSGDGEISSSAIGDMVMEELRQVNEVAYVRFAAVYRKFTDLGDFMSELQKLIGENRS